MTIARRLARPGFRGAPSTGLLVAVSLIAIGCGRQEADATRGATLADHAKESRGQESSSSPQQSAAQPRARIPTKRPQDWKPSDGRARDARMTIPRLGIENLEVRTYVGRTDDAAGHAIQNLGIAASPTGSEGGTGPGGVGNYQVTGHRTSSTRVFEFLPRLVEGDRIRVRTDSTLYVYAVTATRITSFRSKRSLREQRAPVPGRPGAHPTQAKITISTCRTQEDHAEGNYWSDEFDNPEHRIDKIGVLVKTRPN